MIEGSDVGLRIHSPSVPVLTGVRDLMETGFVPGGLYRNRDFRIHQITKEDSCPDWLFNLLFDPQTAGGLFFSLPEDGAHRLAEQMKQKGIHASIIGDVVKEHPGKISVD